MSLFSWLTGTVPQDQQEAQLEDAKRKYQAALDKREAAGTVTPDQAQADQNYVDNLTLNDTGDAAAIGALQGATEIFYDPAQWWKDTKDGARIAADAASSGADTASKKTGLYIAELISKVLKDLFLALWPLLIIAAVVAFFYFGGWLWLKRKLKL